MIKVFIWEHSRSGNWGHAALSVNDERYGTYVSWWPKAQEKATRKYWVDRDKKPKLAKFLGKLLGTDNVYKTKRSTGKSYLTDFQKEGKPPAFEVEIASGVLNEESISIWWKDYSKSGSSYHTIKKNCSTTVIRALRAGGSDRHVAFNHRDNFGLSKYTGWEPTHIVTYLREMAGNLAEGKVKFNDTTKSKAIEESGDGGVEMCTEHGYPLYTCPNC